MRSCSIVSRRRAACGRGQPGSALMPSASRAIARRLMQQPYPHPQQQQQQPQQQQPHPHLQPHQQRACAAAAAAMAPAEGGEPPPSTRRAWHITQPGSLQLLRLQEESLPADLPPGHVLVEVQAWGLNFADVFCCLGLYAAAPRCDFVPGLEFAGVVLDAAEAAEGGSGGEATQHAATYKRGDRVLGVLRFGAFASHITIPAGYLRPVPPGWSFEQAAAYPVQTLTAAYGLYEAGGWSGRGGAVLVHSAAGGVGLQALQILTRCDAAVLALVGNSSKVQLLEQMYGGSGSSGQAQQQQPDQQQQQPGQQARRPLVRAAVRMQTEAAARQQLQDFLQSAGEPGFDVSLDSLGPGAYFQTSYDALTPNGNGRLVIFGAGALTPPPGRKFSLNPLALLSAPASLWGLLQLGWAWLRRPRLDVLKMPGDNKGVVGFNLIWLYDRLELLASLYERVDRLGLAPPHVGDVFSFEELPAALERLQSGRTCGKVVLSRSRSSPDGVGIRPVRR